MVRRILKTLWLRQITLGNYLARDKKNEVGSLDINVKKSVSFDESDELKS